MIQFLKIYSGDKLYAFVALDSETEETTILEKYDHHCLDAILGKEVKYHNILTLIGYRTRRFLYPHDLKKTLGKTNGRTHDDDFSFVIFESKYKNPNFVTHI